jgi:hypothetical protein
MYIFVTAPIEPPVDPAVTGKYEDVSRLSSDAMGTLHEARSTTDIQEIREWVEARGGSPAVVNREGQRTDILRIDFEGSDENLERISWDEFEQLFRQNELRFLYQKRTKGDGESRFFKFVEGTNGR